MLLHCITKERCDMRKKLVRHGNSHALVIDKTLMELLCLGEDEDVLLSVEGCRLIVTPANGAEDRQRRITALAERVMDENDELFRRLAE
jgi:antitoxin component of MazEF toxin-antitoxin module